MILSLTSTPVNAAPAAVAYVPPPVWSQYKGSWASGAIYAINDVVYYAFSSWISLATGNSGNVPAPGSASWQLVAPGVDPTALNNAVAAAANSATSAAGHDASSQSSAQQSGQSAAQAEAAAAILQSQIAVSLSDAFGAPVSATCTLIARDVFGSQIFTS